MKPYPTVAEVVARLGLHPSGMYADLINAEMIQAACDIDRARRGGEGESIPWNQYRWATHAAADEDGAVHVFHGRPEIGACGWLCPYMDSPMERIDATIPGPWTESLRKRPEGV